MTGRTQSAARAIIFFCALWLIVAAGAARPDDPLDGTQWKLVGWKLTSLNLEYTGIHVGFASGSLVGYSGLNTYHGPYSATRDGRFCAGSRCGASSEPLIVTMLGSMDESRHTEFVEGNYLQLFGETTAFKTVGDKLSLYDDTGTEVLTFRSGLPKRE